MSNYSILQQNTLLGFSEGAQHLYLRLCDAYQAHAGQEGERRAFLDACHYEEKVGEVLSYILKMMPIIVPEYGSIGADRPWVRDLERFFADRYLHNFMHREEPIQ